MSASDFLTTQYTSEQYVESAGAILFLLSRRQVCLVRHQDSDKWVLAKGRRNIGEHRFDTALREAEEETGYDCDLLPLTIRSRSPPRIEDRVYPDEGRTQVNATEPFMITWRHLNEGDDLKIIWWYITAIREADEHAVNTGRGERQFTARLFEYDKALAILTYEVDRDVLRKAIEILAFNDHLSSGWSNAILEQAPSTWQ